MMKMLSLVSLMVLTAAVFSPSARGDDAPAPQPPAVPQDVKLTPEMQATLGQLLKMLNPDQAGAPQAGASDVSKMAPMISQLLKSLNSNQGGGGAADATKVAPMVAQLLKMLDMDSTDDSKPAPSPDPSSASTSSSSQNSQPTTTAKPQQTNGLQTRSLRSSSGLVTSSLGGPRMTNDEWRELFPTRH